MNIDQLKEIVQVQNNRLDVTVTELSSSDVDTYITPFLQDAGLAVRDISQHTSDDTSITVTGTGDGRPFKDMPVTVVFKLLPVEGAEDTVGLHIQGTAVSPWSLDKNFDILERTIFSRIQFETAVSLILTSFKYDDAPIDQGMFFDGILAPGSFLDLWTFLLGDGSLSFSGVIEMANGVPNMVLAGPSNVTADLGFLDLTNLTAELYCDPYFNAEMLAWEVDTYVGVSADVPFNTVVNGQAHTHALHFTLDLVGSHDLAIITADFDDGIDAALEELSALVNGTGLSVPFDDLNVTERVTFKQAKIAINPTATPKIQYITLGVQTDLAWDLLDEWLVLQTIDINFRVDFPASGSAQVDGVISGLFAVGQAGALELSVFFGDRAIGGGLRSGSILKIKEVFDHFLNFTPDRTAALHLPDLDVSVFDFYAAPTKKQYRGEINLEGQWQFLENIALEQAYFLMEQTDPATGVTFKAHVFFRIDTIHLALQADYDGIEAGWTFTGATRRGDIIPIGTFLTDLGQRAGVLTTTPTSLEKLQLLNVFLSFNTGKKDFSFAAEADFPVHGKTVALVLAYDLKHYSGSFTRLFGGHLSIAERQFDIALSSEPTTNLLVASYQDTTGGEINVGTLLEAVSSDQSVIDWGNQLSFNLKDALFARYQADANGEAIFLFGLDMGFGINLSGLPLVGQFLAKEQSLRIMFTPIIASDNLSLAEVQKVKALIPAGGTPLPEKEIEKGVALAITLRLGDDPVEINLPIAVNATNGQLAESTSPQTPAPDDGVKWFKIQKSFGPIHFQQVGVTYANGELSFLLDASFSAAGLTLTLDGLSASTPLKEFTPHFSLNGIGVDYSNEAIEIGGAFLRRPRTAERPYDEYDGAAVIRTEAMSLSAIGSYAYVDGHPSLFIYAALDDPLGGPAFFFVTGLAAGFGYNRKLVMPAIEQVKAFPLVEEAVSPSGTGIAGSGDDAANKINNVVTRLGSAVPPTVGEYFLAVGIKFTSFKLIDSFALLVVQFGNEFEIDLLGLSDAAIPSPEGEGEVPLIARVEMALKATFRPYEGTLFVRAQLTPASYLLSPDCHLTGGFAFYTWFNERSGHNGDFVLTLGGYHPHYAVPGHYPQVPRLGFNWRVTNQLTIKGDAYFALTPHAIMAGGHLDATWQDGALSAYFRAGADLLLAWKPYHYELAIYVNMGVKYTYHFFGTHHISVDVGADLSIWGPEFSGKATVHLWIVSFTVRFGHQSSRTPAPLSWNQFKTSFLPQNNGDVCSVAVKDGMVRQIDADAETGEAETWLVDPLRFGLTISTIIPFNEVAFGKQSKQGIDTLFYRMNGEQRQIRPFLEPKPGDPFTQQTQAGDASMSPAHPGVGAMQIASTSGDLHASLAIKIKDPAGPRDANGELPDVTNQFAFVPILKNVPAAMWGDEFRPDLNGKGMVDDTIAGFDIVPVAAPTSGNTNPIDRKNLQYHVDDRDDVFRWAGAATLSVNAENGRSHIQASIMNAQVAETRRDLLAALGMVEPEQNLNLSDSIAGSLLQDPLIITAPTAPIGVNTQ